MNGKKIRDLRQGATFRALCLVGIAVASLSIPAVIAVVCFYAAAAVADAGMAAVLLVFLGVSILSVYVVVWLV